ncbi:Rrf2 family transcriptional regulator, partial [Staphylococcus simulans]
IIEETLINTLTSITLENVSKDIKNHYDLTELQSWVSENI